MISETDLGTHAIQAYLVTSGDEHQSTEVEAYEKRRQYISGFSGSYGDALITLSKAALWTDGRYHLQADEQIDCNWLLFREGHRHVPKMSQWLKEHLPKGGRIGLNPKLVSEYKWNKLKSELKGSSLELVALNVSLIDFIWPNNERSKRQNKASFVVGIEYTGKSYTTKINETRTEMVKLGADAMVVTSLDEIAWLLNIRGRDVPFSPFLRSYVILDMRNIFLYVNISQLNDQTKEYLHSGSTIVEKDSVIEGASHAIYEHIFADRRLPRQSPIIYLKAVKNSVEIKGMQDANIRDAAAIASGEVLTEQDLVQYLDEYRYEQYTSFGNRGTTVVTRTVHFGDPTDDMREAYTRVLIGMIELSTLTFPSNMKMAVADALARASLWEIGLDFEQETGHGVGAFLGTHESPIMVHFDSEISRQQTFKPGYFLSNAPGFYREGDFGVRLENMLEVVEKAWLKHTSGHTFLGFRTVTFVPFEPKLTKLSLLSTQQRRWLNKYNEDVRQLVGSELKKQNRMNGFYWMMEKTKYIPEYGHSNIFASNPLLLILSNTAILIKTFIF
ncbi:hypothetical protein NQ314_005414 [Rhamnusium bicolor]|uniref:Uncharacterized protein n=1 Tax=Rhamnusium bicolor TaxID=1586634 RepID=A0AAV8ZGL0_9CUCU|nr:hypothetical protein NQ314_005414 [Rhamnusium bicolor]